MKAREGWRACYGVNGVSQDALAIFCLHADRESFTRLPLLLEVDGPKPDLTRLEGSDRMRATGGGGCCSRRRSRLCAWLRPTRCLNMLLPLLGRYPSVG